MKAAETREIVEMDLTTSIEEDGSETKAEAKGQHVYLQNQILK